MLDTELSTFPSFMLWAQVKGQLRRECTYSFVALQQAIPRVISGIALDLVQRCSSNFFRYIDGYRHNFTGALSEWAN